ncbi:MAG: caspase family protein [Gammaproteobacteria bacterium]
MRRFGRALCIAVDTTHVSRVSEGARAGEGAEADALALAALATQCGFLEPTVLLGAEATREQVRSRLREAAALCEAGDLFLLTFSGHGGRQSTATAAGHAALRGVWVLYDGSFEDAEMHGALAAFRRGVRVLVVSDSCNGGIPAPGDEPEQVLASVLVMTACRHDQYADTRGHRAHFTSTLMNTWHGRQVGDDAVSGGYRGLHEELLERMPAYQRPNYYWVGLPDAGFEAQQPFTI